MTHRKGPLSHVTVLDLTEFLAGPFGTQILADLGAEVIKVESFEGDSSRHVVPRFIAGSSTYFTAINRSKRSIVVDLKASEGRDIILKLAAKADVLFENRRPGVMARLGLSYDDVCAVNPGIVWCSVSGFGQNGPDRDNAAYDMIVQAMSGAMSLTGERGGKPMRAGVPIGDIAAGMYGAIGVLAALTSRERTGRGDYIDVAMLDVQLAFLSYHASRYLNSGDVAGTQGREHDSIPTYRCFECAGGEELVITANTQKMWESMCRVLGRDDLVADERFRTGQSRQAHAADLVPELQRSFLTQTKEFWMAGLRRAGVPAGPIYGIDEALATEQVAARHMVVELAGEQPEQHARVIGNPVKMKSLDDVGFGFPPALGADTRQVLSELGYAAPVIDRLLAAGVVGEGRSAHGKRSQAEDVGPALPIPT